MGKVYLLGAGPGDPGLITERALRRLGEADLVLYDALVHPDLLSRVRPDAATEFVGKRAGKPGARQERINQRMIEAAREGLVVARLKGGDPYLFGRGSEEAEALSAAGVSFEVVPGVPSPVAATAYAGISLTHRNLSSSVAYVTATESPEKDRSSHAWGKLATATETLVIFMGLRKIDSLMKLLAEHGRSLDTPVAVIHAASLPSQRTIVGTVGCIAKAVQKAELELPSIIVIGHVVELRKSLRWFDTKPLFGKGVLVTRPAGQSAGMAGLLRDEGAAPILVPTIRIVPPDEPKALQNAVANLDAYGWVLFTSRNGVESFFSELKRQGRDARQLGRCRVAAIGPATAVTLAEHGIRSDVVPLEYRGEELARAVIEAQQSPLTDTRILMPRARVAREVLPETLRGAGATVDVVPAYETKGATEETGERLRALLDDGTVDVVTFTSSSTVNHFLSAVGPDAAKRLSKTTVASIGPITTKTAERHGLRVDVTATNYTNQGLVQALLRHFARSSAERSP